MRNVVPEVGNRGFCRAGRWRARVSSVIDGIVRGGRAADAGWPKRRCAASKLVRQRHETAIL